MEIFIVTLLIVMGSITAYRIGERRNEKKWIWAICGAIYPLQTVAMLLVIENNGKNLAITAEKEKYEIEKNS